MNESPIHDLHARFPCHDMVMKQAGGILEATASHRPSIFVACMPKSGSTLVRTAMAAAAGYPTASLVYTTWRNEQDLYFPALVREMHRPIIAQQHARATSTNLELLQTFGYRVVVLTRNLFDIVISVHDHFEREDHRVPTGYITEEWFSFDRTRRLDMIIDLLLPWYFGFYASWQDAIAADASCARVITYEDVVADPVGTLQGALAFCEVERSADEVSRSIEGLDPGKTRFNVGVIGRGTAELTDAQKSRIERLASYYPSVDFAAIGLSGASVS